ncbi:MAG TPA: VOC family protein [Sphingobium sp.]|nr:VOC family protein [Sphingobium sp.]
MQQPPAPTAPTGPMAPFFIVRDVARSLAFYCDSLGFALTHQAGEPPFFALVQRDGAMLFLKSQTGVDPVPNCARHPQLRWDAYCHVADPDALAAMVAARGALFSAPLRDTPDGLRGFEVTDPDGHVLFFGRPQAQPRPR